MNIETYRTKYKKYTIDYHDSYIPPKTLDISEYLFNKKSSLIAIKFAVACFEGNFSNFDNHIAHNIIFVINNKGTIHGKNNFINYWLDHRDLVHRVVQHSILYNRVAVIDIDKKEIRYFLFRTHKEKITHAVYITFPNRYNNEPSSIIRGYNHSFKFTKSCLKNIEKEKIPTKENRVPCLYCGTLSENLNWFNINFIKEGFFYYGASYFSGFISFCPKCQKVIEQKFEETRIPKNLSPKDRIKLQRVYPQSYIPIKKVLKCDNDDIDTINFQTMERRFFWL